ncbi:MAG: phosphatase PAP2 family protein [Oligoflexia bacterium]|nr:phosphatase PAP2 family protein [Oligoflexia bacterium]MBF0364262.1 phosphatase PAP2 family protein [Oligoflexia bacterium]
MARCDRFYEGLRVAAIVVLLTNMVFLLATTLFFQKLFYQNIVAIFLSIVGVYYNPKELFFKRVGRHDGVLFFLVYMLLFFSLMWFDYELVGKINDAAGGFSLYDGHLASWDQYFFGNSPAEKIYLILRLAPALVRTIFFDLLIVSYFLYYPLVFLGLLYFYFNKDYLQRLSRIHEYSFSVIVVILMSLFMYMLVPVTGPQYYQEEIFAEQVLPFSLFGKLLFDFVAKAHPNRIDCFPSVHSALTMLVTYWAFKFKLRGRFLLFFLLMLIITATIALRYHYIWDVLAAIPVVIIALCLAKRVAKFFNLYGGERKLH